MSSESIFGHVTQEQAYNPPIEQSSVMSLESDLAVRPTVDDVNPSGSTVFSSNRVTTLLTTKLSTADVKDFAVSTQETADQTVKSHILTEKLLADFTQNDELVSKEYVDNHSVDLSTAVKNFDNPGTFNTNGDFTTHNLVLESSGTNLTTITILGINSGATTNTNITGWTISRSAAADERNVWYSENGMTPALTDAGNRPAVTTPTTKQATSNPTTNPCKYRLVR